MEYSLNTSLRSWDFVPKNKPTSLGRLVISFSQKASLQSDPQNNPVEFTLKNFEILNRPVGCLATIYALTLINCGSSQAERTERLLKFISNNARNLRYQGNWKLVGELLSIDFHSRGSYSIENKLFPMFTSEEWFGNFLPTVFTIIEKNLEIVSIVKRQKELSKRERFRGIRRKIRRRGYNDRGFRRPIHECHQTGPDWYLDQKEQEFQEMVKKYCIVDPPKRRYFCNASGGRKAGTRPNEGGILE